MYYVCLPLFHVNALCVQVFAALVCGARAYCVERFSPNRWLSDIRTCGATVTNLLGVMTQLVLETTSMPDDHVNDLRAILAVPVADEWIGRFCERFGVRIYQGYGSTECDLVAYSRPDDPPVSGCSGTVRSELFEVAIIDPETDERLADGEVGEIVVRPNVPHAFMQGYFGMPDKTVEAWRNLWFHTGDAGRLEGGHQLHFVDRIKDRIRRRGENISTYEVEQALAAFSGVAECAVVGIQVGDAGSEQEITACIVRRDGVALTHLQVLEHCIAHVPRFIEFVDSLPRTVTDKLQRHLLRARGAVAAVPRPGEQKRV